MASADFKARKIAASTRISAPVQKSADDGTATIRKCCEKRGGHRLAERKNSGFVGKRLPPQGGAWMTAKDKCGQLRARSSHREGKEFRKKIHPRREDALLSAIVLQRINQTIGA